MVSLRSSLSLVEIMYSNSLGGIQSHETGPKRRPQRPPFGNPPTHHNTPYGTYTQIHTRVARLSGRAGGLRAQPGPNTAPLRRRRQSTRLNCAASPSYSGPDNVRSGTLSLFRHGIVPSLWGVALRAHPPSLMLTPLLVWVHPLCGHCHAGARQRSSVMVSLRSSLSLLKSCIAIA